MLYLALKALVSGLIIAAVSEIAKRNPGFGDAGRLAAARLDPGHDLAVARQARQREHGGPCRRNLLVFVLPSLPMFLLIPAMLRHGISFWPALIAGCALTIALYLAMVWLAPRFGITPERIAGPTTDGRQPEGHPCSDRHGLERNSLGFGQP